MKKNPNIRKQLALALDIAEEDILQYARHGNNYSVITTSYQKYVDVRPMAEETAVTPTELDSAEDVPFEGDKKPLLPPDFADDLQLAWNNPRQAKVVDLRELAQLLGIAGITSKTRKADLVNKMIAYKLDYYA